jgi:hypothetical protein
MHQLEAIAALTASIAEQNSLHQTTLQAQTRMEAQIERLAAPAQAHVPLPAALATPQLPAALAPQATPRKRRRPRKYPLPTFLEQQQQQQHCAPPEQLQAMTPLPTDVGEHSNLEQAEQANASAPMPLPTSLPTLTEALVERAAPMELALLSTPQVPAESAKTVKAPHATPKQRRRPKKKRERSAEQEYKPPGHVVQSEPEHETLLYKAGKPSRRSARVVSVLVASACNRRG